MATEQKTTHRLVDVKCHKDADSLWIIIDNKVYDVTPFQDEHPGGAEALLSIAGEDATEEFEDIGHSLDARDMMKSYYIGDLHEDDISAAGTSDSESTSAVAGSKSLYGLAFKGSIILVLAGVLLSYFLHRSSPQHQ